MPLSHQEFFPVGDFFRFTVCLSGPMGHRTHGFSLCEMYRVNGATSRHGRLSRSNLIFSEYLAFKTPFFPDHSLISAEVANRMGGVIRLRRTALDLSPV